MQASETRIHLWSSKNGNPVAVKVDDNKNPVNGDLKFSGEIEGIKVKTAFTILKEEAFSKSLSEWADSHSGKAKCCIEKKIFKGRITSAGKIIVSVGTACYPEDGDYMEKIIRAADDALHVAKETGRNTVVAANRPESLV